MFTYKGGVMQYDTPNVNNFYYKKFPHAHD